jgi:hypothetical protein
MNKVDDIPGWSALVDWFGYSPNFHDAEVVSIDLRRDPDPSYVRVHVWRTNADVDENGFYRMDRHALATFTILGITASNLRWWNHQNVLAGLSADRTDDGCVLSLGGEYGVDGEIEAVEISVSVEAYEPVAQ